MNPKEITLHFLLGMNEDFDDDLLQDVVEIMDYWCILIYHIIIYASFFCNLSNYIQIFKYQYLIISYKHQSIIHINQ